MKPDLIDQLRDYLDWEGPPALSTATPPSPRKGLLVAVGVAVLVLGVGIFSSLLGGDPPPGASTEWCPEGEFPTGVFPHEVPVTCDGPLIGQWQVTGLVIDGEAKAIPSYAPYGHGWIGVHFRGNGSLTAVACNEISGWFKATDTLIATSSIWMTAAGCPGVDDVVESAILTLIPMGPSPEPALSYGIVDDRLTLTSGGVLMTLDRIMKGPPPSAELEWCPTEMRDITDDQPVGSETCHSPLLGRWTLERLEVSDEVFGIDAFVDSTGWVGLQFHADGSWGGSACTGFGGFYQVSESTLVTGEIMSNLPGCVGRVPNSTLQNALRFATFSFSVTGDRLQLRSADTTIDLVWDGPPPESALPNEWCPSPTVPVSSHEPPDQPAFCEGPLVGGWLLVGVEVGGDPLPIPDPGTRRGLTFSSDGRWNGRVCNTFSGQYSMNSNTIRTSGYSTTAAGCFGPEGDVENAILQAMDRTELQYEITDDRLTLMTGVTVIHLVWDSPEPPPFTDWTSIQDPEIQGALASIGAIVDGNPDVFMGSYLDSFGGIVAVFAPGVSNEQTWVDRLLAVSGPVRVRSSRCDITMSELRGISDAIARRDWSTRGMEIPIVLSYDFRFCGLRITSAELSDVDVAVLTARFGDRIRFDRSFTPSRGG